MSKKPTTFGIAADSFTTYELILSKTTATLIERYSSQSYEIAELPIEHWSVVSDPVKAHFNERLKKLNLKTGQWSKQTILEKLFGKELALLMMALSDVPISLTERVLANWNGLRPEERWWLYTQIYSVGRNGLDPDKGWYKGIMIALREN